MDHRTENDRIEQAFIDAVLDTPAALDVRGGRTMTDQTENEVDCACPTDNYCPRCHPRWHAKWLAEQQQNALDADCRHGSRESTCAACAACAACDGSCGTCPFVPTTSPGESE